MLETVREYARERLHLRGELADLRRRHAMFYARLGQAAEPHLRRPGREWLDRVEAEHDNFRFSARLQPRDGRRARLSDRRVPALLLAPAGTRTRGAPLGRACTRSARQPFSDGSGRGAPRSRRPPVLGGRVRAFRLCPRGELALYRAAGDRRRVAEIANTLGNSTWALGDRKRTRKLREDAIRLGWELRDRAASHGRCTTSGRSPGTPATRPEPVERSRRAST